MTRTLKNMVKGTKTTSDPLTALVDRYFLERTGELPFSLPPVNHLRAGGRFTPSSSGDPSKCMRQAVLQFMQVPRKIKRDPETELIFAVGDYTHLLWFNIFLDMERVLGPEVFKVEGIEQLVAYPSLFLAGWYDVRVRIRGRLYLVDFKTINDAGFTRLMQDRSPSRDNVGQLVRYLYSSKVPRGLLVYLNKNDQRFKVFVVDHKLHAQIWRTSVRWYRRAIAHLKAQTLPDMHDDCNNPQSRMARNCPFAYLCYKHRDEDIEVMTYGDKPPYDALWEETTGRYLATDTTETKAQVHPKATPQTG